MMLHLLPQLSKIQWRPPKVLPLRKAGNSNCPPVSMHEPIAGLHTRFGVENGLGVWWGMAVPRRVPGTAGGLDTE